MSQDTPHHPFLIDGGSSVYAAHISETVGTAVLKIPAHPAKIFWHNCPRQCLLLMRNTARWIGGGRDHRARHAGHIDTRGEVLNWSSRYQRLYSLRVSPPCPLPTSPCACPYCSPYL
eukprot:scaffold63176_cov32-Tisochrysis_lutea.AAC.7